MKVNRDEIDEAIDETLEQLEEKPNSFVFTATDRDGIGEGLMIDEGSDSIVLTASMCHSISERTGVPVDDVLEDVVEATLLFDEEGDGGVDIEVDDVRSNGGDDDRV